MSAVRLVPVMNTTERPARGAGLGIRNRELGQNFIERADKLAPPVESNVDGRRERGHLDSFRGAAQHQGAAFRQHEIDAGDAGSGCETGLGKVRQASPFPHAPALSPRRLRTY